MGFGFDLITDPLDVTCLVFFGTSLYLYAHVFLPLLEKRPGLVPLDDPLFHLLEPTDYSNPIAWIQYLVLGVYLVHLLVLPEENAYPAWFIYLVMAGNFYLRSLTIFLTPLAVHPSIIRWRDPVQKQFVPQSREFRNDLFYSGHVSTCVLCGLTCPPLNVVCYLSAVIIGFMMISSRIHYSIDVFAGPFFAYGLFRFCEHWCL